MPAAERPGRSLILSGCRICRPFEGQKPSCPFFLFARL